MSHQSDLIQTDIRAYLKEHENKELLRFITCGSVDDGKSTLIGRLLHDSKLIYEDQLASITKDSKFKGSSDDNLDLALLVDGLQAEREQGITIDVAYRFFSTKRRKFIIADTPGHEQYTRNMATGGSTADLAIILIDARHGVLTQTRRHSFIVSLLGIKHAIVAINKMDIMNYSEEVYKKIKADYLKLSKDLDIEHTVFLPMSALKGDNVVNKSENMPWYTGDVLMELLETIPVTDSYNFDNFRMPVQYVNRPNLNFRGFCGTVASGIIKPGDKITVLPSRKTSKVKSIVTYDGEIDEAFPPMAITITTEDEIDISRGDMIVHSGNIPEVSDCFDAMLVWMNEEPLTKNKSYDLKRASTVVNAYVDEIYYKVDVNTFEHLPAEKLELNEIAYVRINLSSQIAYDTYKEHRQTGSFVIVDRISNNTFGSGMIYKKQASKNVVWHDHKVGRDERVKLKGHKPAVLWLTGLSGAGKSTVANELEESLHRMGVHTYLLDGDNVRHGLCKDLGFSDADRVENIRRIGEVAKLFADSGIMVITAFISPFKKDREMVRTILPEGEFVEIFVDAPLEVCEQRDPKALYKKARNGEIKSFTGIDSPYEAPDKPEVHLRTDKYTVSESVQRILKYLKDNRYA